MILSLSLVSGHQNNGFHWVFKREHRVFTAFAPVTATPPWSHLPILSPTLLLLCLLYQTPDAVFVWVFLMPLNIMVSVPIYKWQNLILCDFIFTWWITPHGVCMTYFLFYSSIHMHLGRFRATATVWRDTVNTNVQMPLLYAVTDSFGCVPKSCMVGSYGSYFSCELSHWIDSH